MEDFDDVAFLEAAAEAERAHLKRQQGAVGSDPDERQQRDAPPSKSFFDQYRFAPPSSIGNEAQPAPKHSLMQQQQQQSSAPNITPRPEEEPPRAKNAFSALRREPLAPLQGRKRPLDLVEAADVNDGRPATADWIYCESVRFPRRDYQYNIVHTALRYNTMVCLPTGLGKTFIAAMIMANYARW
jgi:hypothetical protein